MYLVSGGKTGGHIVPLINIINQNKNDYIYVGCIDYLENKLCKENNISFIGYKADKSKTKMLINGYKQTKKKLKNMDVNAIIISGGFVSLPLGLYAIRHNIPLYLIEANVVFGKVNKLLYPFAKDIFYGFKQIKKKGVLSGLPVVNKTYYNNEIYDILIIGGSLGSKVLCDIAKYLDSKYKICLVCGKYYDEYKNLKGKVIKYSNDIYGLIHSSKIVISRAGGMTLSEIISVNKALICIPSKSTSFNHQVLNAKYLNEIGVLKYFSEDENYIEIEDYIKNMFSNSAIIVNMKDKQKKFVKEDSIKVITSRVIKK